MNFNNFTIKAQEAVQEAVNLAQRERQQMITPVHLLCGLLKVGENVTQYLLGKMGINGMQLQQVADRDLQSLPRVEGGEPYLSKEANEVLLRAEDWQRKTATSLWD